MTLKIKTKDIEIEYQDEYSQLEESPKKRLIEILDKIYERQIEITKNNNISRNNSTDMIIYNNPNKERTDITDVKVCPYCLETLKIDFAGNCK